MNSSMIVQTRPRTDAAWLRLVNVSVAGCVVALAVFFYVATFYDTSSEGDFMYTADYWYTASGIPMALAGTGIALGVHQLQHGADGRLGTIGVWINTLALAELLVQLTASVVAGAELRWGPIYVLCSFLTFVGVALVAVGSWRTGLLPTWMLGIWPLLWILGTFAGSGPIPLVLAALLVAMAVTLNRRRQTTP